MKFTTSAALASTTALIVLLATPAGADQSVSYRPVQSPNELRFRVGTFEPEGGSRYWEEKELDFSGTAGDFDDLVGGVEYRRRLGDRLLLVAGASAFENETRQHYLDFVDDAGLDIVHDTFLEIGSGTVGLAWSLAGPRATVQPWIGTGLGLYAWRLEENGDFIDFVAEPPFIFTDRFEDDGAAFGWYFHGGLDVRLADGVALFAEGRWDSAEDELSGDFQGLGDLDLSGRQLTVGLALRF